MALADELERPAIARRLSIRAHQKAFSLAYQTERRVEIETVMPEPAIQTERRPVDSHLGMPKVGPRGQVVDRHPARHGLVPAVAGLFLGRGQKREDGIKTLVHTEVRPADGFALAMRRKKEILQKNDLVS